MGFLPKIAIVGRPNVGKSALFNRIINKKISIVDEQEGVTRDRIYGKTDLFGSHFELIDTGGIHQKSTALYNEEIKRQAFIAIEEADALIMVVDGQTGLTQLDEEVAQILQKSKKPLCLAINKIDCPEKDALSHEFYTLGIEKTCRVSASHGWQIAELLEKSLEDLSCPQEEAPKHGLHIAIVGRPNAGKSTLVNTLLQEQRCVVSPTAGTTRDSVDIPFSWEEEDYVLIDTAGIRRKNAESEVVDKFASIRTERAIERADVCILMLDAQSGMSTQDKKIANTIEKHGKPCVLAFNKWDLVKGVRMEHCMQVLEQQAVFLKHCPAFFLSAITGRNLDQLFSYAKQVHAENQKRISTGELNRFVAAAMQKQHPPMIMGKRLRVYYLTQINTCPPRFLLFVNHAHLMADSYKRYLYNQFRKAFAFTGVPIEIHIRSKQMKKKHERLEEERRQQASASHPLMDHLDELAVEMQGADSQA